MGTETLEFIQRNDTFQPYAENAAIQNLAKVISSNTMIEIFFNLLLERKVLLISSYKSLLT